VPPADEGEAARIEIKGLVEVPHVVISLPGTHPQVALEDKPPATQVRVLVLGVGLPDLTREADDCVAVGGITAFLPGRITQFRVFDQIGEPEPAIGQLLGCGNPPSQIIEPAIAIHPGKIRPARFKADG
jgi:hypothetical protein